MVRGLGLGVSAVLLLNIFALSVGGVLDAIEPEATSGSLRAELRSLGLGFLKIELSARCGVLGSGFRV